MTAFLNFACLVFSSAAFTVFYVKSVSPAALEKKIGAAAYPRAATYRLISGVFMFISCANYFVYYYYPLPLSDMLPDRFPLPRALTVALAVLIAVPSSYLMIRGARDAGEETMRPKKEHEMYGGIYRKIRHPQAVGEFPLWWVMALLANSPFLTFFSFLYVPVWYYFCVAEEKDLRIRYGEAFKTYQSTVGFWIPKRLHHRAA